MRSDVKKISNVGFNLIDDRLQGSGPRQRWMPLELLFKQDLFTVSLLRPYQLRFFNGPHIGLADHHVIVDESRDETAGERTMVNRIIR